MPRSISHIQQHRHHVGNHTAWEDARQRSQVDQDAFTLKLANRPGLHSHNEQRQATAAAAVQLLSLLSCIRNVPGPEAQGSLVKVPDGLARAADEGGAPNPASQATSTAGPGASTVHALKDVLAGVGNFLEQHDPLRFPMAQAMPLRRHTGASNGKLLSKTPFNFPRRTGEAASGAADKASRLLDAVTETVKEFFTTSPLKRVPLVTQAELFGTVFKACFVEQTCKSTADAMRILADKIDEINARPGARFSLMTPLLQEARNIIHDYIDPPTGEDQKADRSCVPDTNEWTFPGLLGVMGEVLEHPVQSLSVGAGELYALATTGKCLTPLQERRLADISQLVDTVVSDVASVVPGLNQVAVAQGIVGPLLKQTSDDLQGKPVRIEERGALYGQMLLQATISIHQSSRAAVKNLKAAPEDGVHSAHARLPKFHIKHHVNHIQITLGRRQVKVPVSHVKRKVFADIWQNGATVRHEVHWNHVHQEWRLSGTGKFNRFSKAEQKTARNYGIDHHWVEKSTAPGHFYYEIANPYRTGERIEAIEMHGRFVPFRRDAETGRTYVYDASDASAPEQEVVFTQNEWHLKARAERLESLQALRTESGETLDVAVVKVRKSGQPVFAQMDREAGFFYGPNYTLNDRGLLEPVEVKSMGPVKGPGASKVAKPGGSGVTKNKRTSANSSFAKTIYKRHVDGSPFIQYLSDSGRYTVGSERLVVAAHGQYDLTDYVDPPVELSEGMTYKLLTPHDTFLTDPGLPYFLNPSSDFKAYVTLNKVNGQTFISGVDFNSQEAWAFSPLPDHFDPYHLDNTLGRSDGLQGITLWHYSDYSPDKVVEAMAENRRLAKMGTVPRTDLLMVDPQVTDPSQAKLVQSDTARIIELDKLGKLRNANGKRYKEIVFAHCRSFAGAVDVPLYQMRPISGPARHKRDAQTRPDNILHVTITRMSRDDVHAPFKVEYLDQRYELIPGQLMRNSTAPAAATTTS